MPGPFPLAGVLGLGLQTQFQPIAVQLKHKPRLRLQRIAKLAPVHPFAVMRPPQRGNKARAQLGDGGTRIGDPLGEQFGRWAVAQEIKGAVPEHQSRAAGEEHSLLDGRFRAVGQA